MYARTHACSNALSFSLPLTHTHTHTPTCTNLLVTLTTDILVACAQIFSALILDRAVPRGTAFNAAHNDAASKLMGLNQVCRRRETCRFGYHRARTEFSHDAYIDFLRMIRAQRNAEYSLRNTEEKQSKHSVKTV